MTGTSAGDRQALRELVRQYIDLTRMPVYEERRELWRRHMSLERTRPLVLATYGMHNVWCREVFGDKTLVCEDPALRAQERALRMAIFHDTIGDDYILEPWLTVGAVHRARGGIFGGLWGLAENRRLSDVEGGSWKGSPPIKEWGDIARMVAPRHDIDEVQTAAALGRLQDAVGDLIAIDLDRGPAARSFAGDISTTIASLRGLDQLMIDMYESPDELHRLLAFMRDGILANQREAEDAGDFGLTCHANQSMPYSKELEDPAPNARPRKRRQLWGFFAAQEYTLVSPEFHERFLFRYQLPIMAAYGLTHYGCCEDLTRKIDMLRQAPNLRSIGVSPMADLARCAEQIGSEYVLSWRPSPSDMVAHRFDPGLVLNAVTRALEVTRGCHLTIHLKDIETVNGEPGRLGAWVALVRRCVEQAGRA